MTAVAALHSPFSLQAPAGPSVLGARMSGVELSGAVDDALLDAIHETYLKHHVVSIAAQQLSAEDLVRFSRRFGDLERHVLSQYAHPEHPDVLLLSNESRQDGGFKGLADAGSYWHSDLSYKAQPCLTTILYAIDVPETGGDTLFCDLTAAYEALPEDMKQRLEGLQAVHDYAQRSDRLATESGKRDRLTDEQRKQVPSVVHPVVRTHPQTGRKALYINEGFVTHIIGLPKAESDALLAELHQHCVQEQFRYTYHWAKGDLLIWDNAAIMHAATTRDLDPTKRRVLWRTIIKGEAPV